jgi:hypothetical protein
MKSRQEMFHAACAYHGALATYSRAMRFGEDLEKAAQEVVGASLRYHVALERLMAVEPDNSDCARRSQSLRKLLYSTSAKYNLSKRPPRARDQGTRTLRPSVQPAAR